MVADYLALSEDAEVHHELQEGILVMSPRPIPDHQLCRRRTSRQLEDQIPSDLEVLPESMSTSSWSPANGRPRFARRTWSSLALRWTECAVKAVCSAPSRSSWP